MSGDCCRKDSPAQSFAKNEKLASTLLGFKLWIWLTQIFGLSGGLLAHALQLPPLD
jgi:hypothetical protein